MFVSLSAIAFLFPLACSLPQNADLRDFSSLVENRDHVISPQDRTSSSPLRRYITEDISLDDDLARAGPSVPNPKEDDEIIAATGEYCTRQDSMKLRSRGKGSGSSCSNIDPYVFPNNIPNRRDEGHPTNEYFLRKDRSQKRCPDPYLNMMCCPDAGFDFNVFRNCYECTCSYKDMPKHQLTFEYLSLGRLWVALYAMVL